MVFSSTSHKTPNVLTALDIDYLTSEKRKERESVCNEFSLETQAGTAPSPLQGSCFSEEFLNLDPELKGTMFSTTESEFFQDLGIWCSPEKDEQTQIIDIKKHNERALNTDTTHTVLSTHGLEAVDFNSPSANSGFYTSTPSLSPSVDNDKFIYPCLSNDNHEQFLDINSLPMVFGELPSGNILNTNQLSPVTEKSWVTLHNTTDTDTIMPFIHQEDSMDYDTKFITWSEDNLLDVQSENSHIAEIVINSMSGESSDLLVDETVSRNLKLDLTAQATSFVEDPIINTPDILCFVEQLENETFLPQLLSNKKPSVDILHESPPETTASTINTNTLNISSDWHYDAITPKSESQTESEEEVKPLVSTKRKRRRNSDDSDETYTPQTENLTPRKYKRRKQNVPIEDMIELLEGSQLQHKVRRGRPPKRRVSVVSSVCSIDDTCSTVSTHGDKYREVRDKNNEASKRSRMQRKLKELQIEQLAIDLEEKNKKLQVKVDVLEDITKKLKESLIAVMLKK